MQGSRSHRELLAGMTLDDDSAVTQAAPLSAAPKTEPAPKAKPEPKPKPANSVFNLGNL